MIKRVLSIVILAFFSNLILGCTLNKLVDVDKSSVEKEEVVIAGVVLLNGESVIFDKPGGRYNPSKNAIVGVLDDTLYIEISYDEIQSIKVYKPDKLKRAFAGIGSIVIVGVLCYLAYQAISKKVGEALVEELF
jgi:hypothetical protein